MKRRRRREGAQVACGCLPSRVISEVGAETEAPCMAWTSMRPGCRMRSLSLCASVRTRAFWIIVEGIDGSAISCLISGTSVISAVGTLISMRSAVVTCTSTILRPNHGTSTVIGPVESTPAPLWS